MAEATKGRGLGLTSTRERLNLVGGNLTIDSQLQRGTTIVVAMDEAFDLGDQFFDAAEGSPADGLLRDDVKPDFHLVEPGRVGRREVQVGHWQPAVTRPAMPWPVRPTRRS